MNNGPAVQSPRPPVSTGQTQPLNVAMAGAEVPVTAPPVTPAGNGVPNGAERPVQPVAAPPDYSSLPPGIAESLARLAGTPRPRSDSAARGPSQKAATPNGKLGDK